MTGRPAQSAPSAVFRSSSLQREYRKVLDAAHRGPVAVLDRDELLGVERWSELEFAHGVVAALEDIQRFQAAFDRHGGEPPEQWAAMTPYPWLRALDSGEVQEFAAELLPHLLAAVAARSLDVFAGNLRAWQSTAETYDDPELLAAMLAGSADEAPSEVHPPAADPAASGA